MILIFYNKNLVLIKLNYKMTIRYYDDALGDLVARDVCQGDIGWPVEIASTKIS